MWGKINVYFKLPIISFVTVLIFFAGMLEWRNPAYIIGIWIALWVYSIVTLHAIGIGLDNIK